MKTRGEWWLRCIMKLKLSGVCVCIYCCHVFVAPRWPHACSVHVRYHGVCTSVVLIGVNIVIVSSCLAIVYVCGDCFNLLFHTFVAGYCPAVSAVTRLGPTSDPSPATYKYCNMWHHTLGRHNLWPTLYDGMVLIVGTPALRHHSPHVVMLDATFIVPLWNYVAFA